jgi:chromate transport protein ChrA
MSAPQSDGLPEAPSRRVAETFRAFLIQGATSFGGPAAGLGSLEAEFARRRNWIPEEKARELLTWVN